VALSKGNLASGLVGNFYNVVKVQGVVPTVISSDSSIVQVDSIISFNWTTNSPISGVTTDSFIVVWTGVLQAPQTGRFNLYFEADDGIRVYFAGELIVDSWAIENVRTIEVSNLLLDSSITYDFRLEYFEQDGSAQVQAAWESPSLGINLTVIPASAFFHEERCDCTGTGFVGTYCTVNSNDCSSNPCGNNGLCVDGLNTFTCFCYPGYTGQTCNTASTTVCKNGGRQRTDTSILSGLLGSYFNLGTGQAVANPVPIGDSSLRSAEAVNFVSYDSVTTPGLTTTSFMTSWQGSLSPPNSGVFSFVVTTNGGFRLTVGGQVLLTNWFDESDSYQVDGIYLDYTVEHAILLEYFKTSDNSSISLQWMSSSLSLSLQAIPLAYLSYSEPCDCTQTGFTGSTCTTNENDCITYPCLNGGTCVDGFESSTCVCPAGYTGSLCDTEDTATCSNNGVARSVTKVAGLKGVYRRISPNPPPTTAYGPPVVMVDTDIQTVGFINYTSGAQWPSGVPSSSFMATWQGFLVPSLTGYYDITVAATDGCRVYLGGVAIHDQWHLMTQSSYTYSSVFLDASENYNFTVEFFNYNGSPQIVVSWASTSLGIAKTPIPATNFFHYESCDCTGTGYVGDQCTISIFPSLPLSTNVPTMHICSLDINECYTLSCDKGFCVDYVKYPLCHCPNGFLGVTCSRKKPLHSALFFFSFLFFS